MGTPALTEIDSSPAAESSGGDSSHGPAGFRVRQRTSLVSSVPVQGRFTMRAQPSRPRPGVPGEQGTSYCEARD